MVKSLIYFELSPIQTVNRKTKYALHTFIVFFKIYYQALIKHIDKILEVFSQQLNTKK